MEATKKINVQQLRISDNLPVTDISEAEISIVKHYMANINDYKKGDVLQIENKIILVCIDRRFGFFNCMLSKRYAYCHNWKFSDNDQPQKKCGIEFETSMNAHGKNIFILSNIVHCANDGSIESGSICGSGFEWIFEPLPQKFWNEKNVFFQMLEKAQKKGVDFRAWDTNCGIHLHTDSRRTDLFDATLKSLDLVKRLTDEQCRAMFGRNRLYGSCEYVWKSANLLHTELNEKGSIVEKVITLLKLNRRQKAEVQKYKNDIAKNLRNGERTNQICNITNGGVTLEWRCGRATMNLKRALLIIHNLYCLAFGTTENIKSYGE